jgi:hypothetical protein
VLMRSFPLSCRRAWAVAPLGTWPLLQPTIHERLNLLGGCLGMLAPEVLALDDDSGRPQVECRLEPLREKCGVSHIRSVPTLVRQLPGRRLVPMPSKVKFVGVAQLRDMAPRRCR